MSEILAALIFGFTLAISVGPIALIIIQNGITGGFAAAGRSALGAALGDFSYALCAFLVGAAVLKQLLSYSNIIKTLSSLVLLLFGLYLCLGAVQARKAVLNTGSTKLPGVRATFLLTIVNPLTIIGFTAFIGQSPVADSLAKLLAMAVAVFTGSLAAQLIFALGGAQLKPWLGKPALVTGIKILSGLGVAGFAILGLVSQEAWS